MGQGDRHTVTHSVRRASAGLALLTCALVGCGDGNNASHRDFPIPPHPWLGGQATPGSDVWVSVDPWLPPAPASAPYAASAGVADVASTAPAPAPYQYTPRATNPALVAGPAPLPAIAESAESGVDAPASLASAGPREIAAVTPPAASSSAAESPTSAALLAPAAMPAEERTPAPGDAMVVDEMQRPLAFPAEPSVNAALVTPTPNEGPTQPPALMFSAATPTGRIVNERAIERIRRGYELAERGAYFAARNEFLTALRMIAEAKDQIHGAPRRTIALAHGLRAVEEAADFAATGSAAELDLVVIVASHRTPVGKSLDLQHVLPQQLADAYLNYAEVQLASAVAGEPTGSIALHALGKLNSQLGRTEPATNPQASARAFALQEAALRARSDNHLAAHELGVLLAESGHYVESDHLLRQVATRAPHAVVYRNLARVERQLGRPDLAQTSERQAAYLASRGADVGGPVAWVSADALARTPDPLGSASPPGNIAATPPGLGHAGPRQGVPMMARGPANTQR